MIYPDYEGKKNRSPCLQKTRELLLSLKNVFNCKQYLFPCQVHNAFLRDIISDVQNDCKEEETPLYQHVLHTYI